MKLNRAALIKALKSQEEAVGYTLDVTLPDDELLAAIKSIIADHNIELAGTDDETVETIFARKEAPKARLRLKVDAESGEIVELGNKATRVNGVIHSGLDSKALRNIQDAKSYDMKCAQWAATGRKRAYKDGSPKLPDSDTAARFGATARLSIAGSANYAERQNDLDIVGKTFYTNNVTLGGAFVPDEFQAILISLKEEYGVAMSLAENVSMERDVVQRPRRTSGLTVYCPGEGVAGTASTAGTDLVSLSAKELFVLCTGSRQWFHDSAINAGNFIAEEIAYAFSQSDDDCYFNGDGTSTYFGYTGVRTSLYGGPLGTSVSNIAGLVAGTAAGADYVNVTLNDYLKLQGRLPSYVKNPKWVFHKQAFYNGPAAKAYAAGGVTRAEVEDGMNPRFLGAPVVFSQVMPRTAATNQVYCIYGDLSLGTMIGNVAGGMEIASSDQRYFDQGLIAFRGTQRLAITCHSPGNADATAANRVPGPYVGMITASS